MDQATFNPGQNQGGGQVNPKKLFIGNLSWNLSLDDLRAEFSKFGTVEDAIILMDKFQRSKGFGFVTMSTEEEAQAAIEGLNGVELDGRQIAVNVAQPPRPRDDRHSSGGYNDRRGGGDRGGYRGGSSSRGNGGGYGRSDDRGGRRDY